MTLTCSDFTVNTLESFSFIAGTPQELTFDIYDADEAEVDLSTATCSVAISPYGQYNYVALDKAGVVSGSPINRFVTTLDTDDTSLLEGKYTLQPVVIDYSGSEFRPAQGVVLIIGRNATV